MQSGYLLSRKRITSIKGDHMKALIAFLCFAAVTVQAQAGDVVLIDQGVVKAAGGFPFKITGPGSYRLTGP